MVAFFVFTLFICNLLIPVFRGNLGGAGYDDGSQQMDDGADGLQRGSVICFQHDGRVL
ncbi:MAG: hypothetical protein J6J76_02020 [Paraprevotella sp.]|nr:hypothetical protein [Paraprevotella sp.]